MPILTPDELRFELKRGLQSLPRGALQDLHGKPDKREAALDLATDILLTRFSDCTVTREDRKPLDFGDMEKGRRPETDGQPQ